MPTAKLEGRCATVPVGGVNAPVLVFILIIPELDLKVIEFALLTIELLARLIVPPATDTFPETVKSPITLLTLTAV
jgi:hypothetical protein